MATMKPPGVFKGMPGSPAYEQWRLEGRAWAEAARAAHVGTQRDRAVPHAQAFISRILIGAVIGLILGLLLAY